MRPTKISSTCAPLRVYARDRVKKASKGRGSSLVYFSILRYRGIGTRNIEGDVSAGAPVKSVSHEPLLQQFGASWAREQNFLGSILSMWIMKLSEHWGERGQLGVRPSRMLQLCASCATSVSEEEIR